MNSIITNEFWSRFYLFRFVFFCMKTPFMVMFLFINDFTPITLPPAFVTTSNTNHIPQAALSDTDYDNSTVRVRYSLISQVSSGKLRYMGAYIKMNYASHIGL